jgi:hypothetical protein
MDDFSLFALLTGSLGVVILIAYFLINTILTGWLASQKGYSVGSWVALSIFFGPIAFLTLGFAPNLNTKATLNSIKRSLEFQKDGLTSNSNNGKQATPIIKDNNILSDTSNNEDVKINDSLLLNRTQYDDLSFDNKHLYRTKIENKIRIETSESIKQSYFKNLFDLGYPNYDKHLPK